MDKEEKEKEEREMRRDGMFTRLSNCLLVSHGFWVLFGSLTIMPAFLVQVRPMIECTNTAFLFKVMNKDNHHLLWDSSCHNLTTVSDIITTIEQ